MEHRKKAFVAPIAVRRHPLFNPYDYFVVPCLAATFLEATRMPVSRIDRHARSSVARHEFFSSRKVHDLSTCPFVSFLRPHPHSCPALSRTARNASYTP